MIITLIYICLVFWIIQKWSFFNIEGIRKFEFYLAFSLKLFTGFILYLIYTEYYEQRSLADIFKFYDDSKIISDVALSKPIDFLQILFGLDFDKAYFESNYFINMNHWETSYKSVIMNESRLIIKINALFNLVGFNNYIFNAANFILIGYLGLIMIIKSFFNQIKMMNTRLLFWSCMLFPSIVLWTSGILKEPLTFFAIGLILFGIQGALAKKKKSIVILVIGGYLLFMIKFYVFACFVPALITFMIIKKRKLNPFKTIFSASIVLLTLIVLISFLSEAYNPIGLLSRKQNDFIGLAEFSKSGSYFKTSPIKNNLLSFIKAIPEGIFNGFLRPLPGDIKKSIHLLPLVENILLICFAGGLLLKVKKNINKLSMDRKQIILCALFFAFLLYTLTGMSTPVVGALVRYKIPGSLFIIISLNIIYDFYKNNFKEKF